MSMKNNKIHFLKLSIKEMRYYLVARYITQIGGLETVIESINENLKQKRITKQNAKRKINFLKKVCSMDFSNITDNETQAEQSKTGKKQ